MQRVRIGLTGLAFVFVLVLLAAVFTSPSSERPITANSLEQQLNGSTDLAVETQKLRVVVVPEVSAGGASLAYAAINPAIALGAFLAQLILSRPVAAANTREFHITGTWDDPKVEKVEPALPARAASGASAP